MTGSPAGSPGGVLGHLRALRRYPFKSMRGEELEQAYVGYSGVAGDRVHAFVDPAKPGNFPWVTARQVPEMLLFEPRFIQPLPLGTRYPDPAAYRVVVRAPDGGSGVSYDVDDPGFVPYLEKRWNRPLVLRFSERGMQDARPISLFAFATLGLLEAEAGMKLDPHRFRANFYVEWEAGAALFEEQLLGKELRIGEKLRILIDKKDPRCVIINLDPATAVSAPQVLATVGKRHAGAIGVYAVVTREGEAAVGDPIALA